MSCELIRVDFRSGTVKCRTSLDPAKPKFNPYEDPFFKEYTRSMGELATLMYDKGLDQTQMVTVALDDIDNSALVIFGTDLMLVTDAVKILKTAIAKLEESVGISPEPEPNGAA